MLTYPLQSISIEEAKEKQFRLVDEICKVFPGSEFLNLGDLGVTGSINKPTQTEKVEKVLAAYFNVEKALLVTVQEQVRFVGVYKHYSNQTLLY